jgi:hypothetical protein
MLPHGHNAINRARALVYRAFGPVKPLRPAARAWVAAHSRGAQVRRAAAKWRGILNHRHLA